jgi:hypothetical protein
MSLRNVVSVAVKALSYEWFDYPPSTGFGGWFRVEQGLSGMSRSFVAETGCFRGDPNEG